MCFGLFVLTKWSWFKVRCWLKWFKGGRGTNVVSLASPDRKDKGKGKVNWAPSKKDSIIWDWRLYHWVEFTTAFLTSLRAELILKGDFSHYGPHILILDFKILSLFMYLTDYGPKTPLLISKKMLSCLMKKTCWTSKILLKMQSSRRVVGAAAWLVIAHGICPEGFHGCPKVNSGWWDHKGRGQAHTLTQESFSVKFLWPFSHLTFHNYWVTLHLEAQPSTVITTGPQSHCLPLLIQISFFPLKQQKKPQRWVRKWHVVFPPLDADFVIADFSVKMLLTTKPPPPFIRCLRTSRSATR